MASPARAAPGLDQALAAATLTGTIDNFRLSGETEDSGWSVTLKKGTGASVGVFTGTTIMVS